MRDTDRHMNIWFMVMQKVYGEESVVESSYTIS